MSIGSQAGRRHVSACRKCRIAATSQQSSDKHPFNSLLQFHSTMLFAEREQLDHLLGAVPFPVPLVERTPKCVEANGPQSRLALLLERF